MKSKHQILKWLAMLLILIASSVGAMAQHQTTCSGTKSYSVNDVTSGNKFSWTVSPALPDGSISNASGESTDITWPNPAVPTDYTVTFREINDDTQCWAERLLTVTVNPTNTVTLTSGVGSNNRTLCVNTLMSNITYATTGASDATFSGLPDGVSGEWEEDAITISGTPTVSGTFNYTVTLTGGCGTVTTTGTITVNPTNTVTLSSVASTAAQSVCINSPITDITYATTSTVGTTTVDVTGLPTGVSYTWVGNVVKISGTPSVTAGSPYTYTITVSGGCGSDATITGTITVNPGNTVTLSSAANTDAQSVCMGNAITDIEYTTTGATSVSVADLPTGVTYSWEDNKLTISGTPSVTAGSPFNYTVTLNAGCGIVTTTGSIIVNPLPNPSEINFN